MSKTRDELLDVLRRREFHLDCVAMELVREHDGKRFVGPGYIRQMPVRNFQIKIYVGGKMSGHDIFSAWL